MTSHDSVLHRQKFREEGFREPEEKGITALYEERVAVKVLAAVGRAAGGYLCGRVCGCPVLDTATSSLLQWPYRQAWLSPAAKTVAPLLRCIQERAKSTTQA